MRRSYGLLAIGLSLTVIYLRFLKVSHQVVQFIIDSDDTGCWAPEKDMHDLDGAAYALLMETIQDAPRF